MTTTIAPRTFGRIVVRPAATANGIPSSVLLAGHRALVHPDGSDCPDGCDAAPFRIDADTRAAMMADEMAALRAENARLKAAAAAPKAPRALTLKVTDKGGLSVYGLGRFPVTLYRSQWERLLGAVDTIRAFIEANADRLTDSRKE